MIATMPGIDEHAEHQPLVHDGEHLPPLADQSEPLGPWRDESGRRCVHRAAPVSLALPECLAGSGASGSFFAMRDRLCHRLGRDERRLIHRFLRRRTGGLRRPGLGGREARLIHGRLGRLCRRNRLVRGLLAVAGGNVTTDRAGTSRVSVFRLAWWSKPLGRRLRGGAPESSVSGFADAPVRRPGAGAEARTTGAWKSTLCCGLGQLGKLEAALRRTGRRPAPTARRRRRSSARAATAGRACRSRSGARACRAGRARSWSRRPRAGALGGDPKRHEVAAERRSGAAGDHEDRAEAAALIADVSLRAGA